MTSDFGNVQLLNREAQKLHVVSRHGFTGKLLEDSALVAASSRCAYGRAWRNGCVIFVADVDTDPEYAPFRSAARTAGYRSVISVPIRALNHGVIGIISAHYRAPQNASMSRVIAAHAFGAVAGDVFAEAGFRLSTPL